LNFRKMDVIWHRRPIVCPSKQYLQGVGDFDSEGDTPFTRDLVNIEIPKCL
jgi:hypothetical protein